ncbi:TetR/AcrR family transcriptional regulator [Pseudonocardia acaciae]|uniref:TetR/AcrR family transcriptional regulator n=1 Tax=Pseudonocardia acaciae TaxID=551276 RepID=UPI00049058F8|nr:TetR/AcrR family transcriptional regulator [Pseudonocardia acaciae]
MSATPASPDAAPASYRHQQAFGAGFEGHPHAGDVVEIRTVAETGDGKPRDIVAAAQELFGQAGYHKTSVQEIAERANVALGTVYAHFPRGKGDVLDAALADRLQRLVAHVLGGTETDPVDQFFDAVRRLNSERVRDPLLRRMQSERGGIPEPRMQRRGRDVEALFRDVAVSWLREMDAAGLIHCRDPEAVADLLGATTRGWLRDLDDGHEPVAHDRVLQALLDAVRALVTVRRPT